MDVLKRKLTQSQEAQVLFNSLEHQEEEKDSENEKQIKPPTQIQPPSHLHTLRIEVPESDIALVVCGGMFTIERQTERQAYAWKMELPSLDGVFATDLLDDWFHRFQINNGFTDRRPPQHLIITKTTHFVSVHALLQQQTCSFGRRMKPVYA